MKRIIACLLGISILFTLCACGVKETEKSEVPVTTLPETTEIINEDDEIVNSMSQTIAETQEKDDILKESAYQEATQADMNGVAFQRNQLWEALHTEIWEALEQKLDAKTLEDLKAEHRNWEEEKESRLNALAEELGGGSLTGTVVNGESAKMTRERALILFSYLEGTASPAPDGKGTDEDSRMEAILNGTGTFRAVDFEQEVTITDFCSVWGNHSGITVTTPQYSALDMDGDGIDELVFKVLINGVADYGVTVLHWENGSVYGFTFSERQMGNIKEDGSFSYSGGEDADGTARITFTGDTYSYTELPLESHFNLVDITWYEYPSGIQPSR